MIRSQFAAIAATLALVGCGESAGQKDARQQREDARAISQLNEATRKAAEAGIAEHQAEAAHKRAVEKLREDERAAAP